MSQTESGYTMVPKWHMVLAELRAQDRAVLAARLRRVVLPPRTPVFQQGEPSDQLVVIESGRVRVFQISEHGQTYTQAVGKGPSTIGLAALVARQRRDTSAETIDTCTLQVMPAREFLDLMYALPGLGAGVARLLATTAIESCARAEALVVDSARMRLARTLVSLGIDKEVGGTARQIDGITQEDLARMVGVSRTWVVVLLKLFEEQGLIQRYRRCIIIPNAVEILRFAQDGADTFVSHRGLQS